jgi:prevent-host-death family protein
MLQMPQIEPVTRMVRDHRGVLEKLKDGPVFLTQRGREAAVIVSVAEWRLIATLLKELEDLRRQARIERSKRVYEAMQADPAQVVSQEEYERMLAEAGLAA